MVTARTRTPVSATASCVGYVFMGIAPFLIALIYSTACLTTLRESRCRRLSVKASIPQNDRIDEVATLHAALGEAIELASAVP